MLKIVVVLGVVKLPVWNFAFVEICLLEVYGKFGLSSVQATCHAGVRGVTHLE